MNNFKVQSVGFLNFAIIYSNFNVSPPNEAFGPNIKLVQVLN